MAVDRLGRPLRDDPYRGNVRVYAASNITLSGLQTIDGVTLESGDRILCNGQTTTSQNGIYVASSGVWSRSRDLSTSDDFTGPIIVTVEEGTTYRNTFWHMLPASTITVGTDAVSFTSGYPAAQFGVGDALSVFGVAGNSTAARDDIAAGTDHHVLRRSGTSLGFGLLGKDNITATATDPLRININTIANPAVYGTWDRTGTDDSRAALNAALAVSGKRFIELGEGTFRIDGTISMTQSNQRIIGAGEAQTTLNINSATAAGITISSGLTSPHLIDFAMTRTGTPGSAAYGVYCVGRLDTPVFRNIKAGGHRIGFLLRGTGYGKLHGCSAFDNTVDGVYILNDALSGELQWYIDDLLLQGNAGRGMIVGSAALGSVTAVALGDWNNIRTYGNTLYGVAVVGVSGVPINGIRMRDCFIGGDGAGELYLDTYGSLHSIHDSFFELAGAVATGPGFATSASGVGHGVQITANNTDVLLQKVTSYGNSQDGINTSATSITRVHDCEMRVNGGVGFRAADGSKASLQDSYFASNTGGNVTCTTNATSLVACGNTPSSLDNILFTQSGTGAVARNIQGKLRERVTPQDFTASTIDDYTTDASSAIQAAIDYAATTGKQVYIPAGTYKVGTALEVKGNGTCLVGDGWLSTILKSPNADNDIITFAGGISSVQVVGIGLDRAVTPNTGVAGLRTPENSWMDCTLRDIWSRRSAIGFVLGATAYGKGFNLRAELNTEHGFHQTAGDVATSPQWYLNGIYSGSNGGDGYLITTDAASVAAAACGEITDLQIYGNSGRGFAAVGTSAAPIQSVRLKNKIFIGQDGSHSIYLDTYGTNHELQGLHLEETGTTTTGPTQSDPASWEGHGLMITANNNTVHLSDALINGHSWSGIHSSTPLLITKDVVVKNNGRALDSGHAYRSGIHVAAGVLVGDPSTAGTSDAAQQYGVSFAADGAHHLDGHDLRGNSAAPIAASVSVPTLELSGGYPAEVRCTDVDPPDLVLSLATGNPYPAGTLTNQVTLYLTPAGRGRKLPLFNGVNWSAHNTAELSYTINESAISPEAAVADKNYDVFAFYDRATLAPKVSKGFAWSSSTARGTGAGTTELELFNGFWVNKYDITNAAAAVTIPARQGLYLGTFRSNVSTYIDFNFHNVDVNGSGAANRCSVGIWNMFNRRDIVASWYTSASSWTYSSQTVRQRNAQANDKLVVISGLAADDFSTSVDALMTSVDVSVAFWRGFGLDSTSTFYGAYGSNLTEAAGGFPRVPVLDGIPAQIGFHELTVLERIQQAAKSATAYGGRQHSTALVRWRA